MHEIPYWADTPKSNGGFSAYHLVFGSDPAYLNAWEENDRDLDFARDASVSSRLASQWKLRVLAQEAMLKDMDNGQLRRIMHHHQTFNSFGIAIGDAVVFYKQTSRKVSPI